MNKFSNIAMDVLFDLAGPAIFNPEFFATQYFPVLFIWASTI